MSVWEGRGGVSGGGKGEVGLEVGGRVRGGAAYVCWSGGSPGGGWLRS